MGGACELPDPCTERTHAREFGAPRFLQMVAHSAQAHYFSFGFSFSTSCCFIDAKAKQACFLGHARLSGDSVQNAVFLSGLVGSAFTPSCWFSARGMGMPPRPLVWREAAPLHAHAHCFD